VVKSDPSRSMFIATILALSMTASPLCFPVLLTVCFFVTFYLLEDFNDVIDVNLRGTFLTCKYFSKIERLESLACNPFSSAIINIGSVVGMRGNKGQSNYAASKGGVFSMTLSMAKELAKYNVRANCILPGFIDTPMSAKVPEHIKNHMISNIPMNRFGTTENVSDLVLFLASERAAYITGEGVEISGSISV
jgi:NAD(P)-dependent dehydrogenase (short-subunit alcohol dehydrogenase family)